MAKSKKLPLSEIQHVAERAQAASASGIDFAPDFEIVNGAKLFYKTVAHDWVMAKLSFSPYDKSDQIEQSIFVVFLLSFDSVAVRSEGCALLRQPKKFTDAAWNFIEKYSLSPETMEKVLPTLIGHPYAATTTSEDSDADPTNANTTTGQS